MKEGYFIMIRNTTKLQKFGWVLFILYLIALTYFLFFAESFGRVPGAQTDYAYNLMPFREISRFIKYRGLLGFQAVFLTAAEAGSGEMRFLWDLDSACVLN